MKTIRFLDCFFSSIGLLVLSPVFAITFVFCILDVKKPFFYQARLGMHKNPFVLIKFRSMPLETPDVLSHEVGVNCINKISRWGQFIRRYKLDEIPQLWNVLRGDMSLVGPRPGLLTDAALIKAREDRGVFSVKPGITGFSQVLGIDMSTPLLLAETDYSMIKAYSTKTYLKIIYLTLVGKGMGDALKKKDKDE